MQELLDCLNLELADIQEDVSPANLHLTSGKAGDYGCGIGITTIALMIYLDLAEVIGVDNDSITISRARMLFEKVGQEILNYKSHQKQQVNISSAFESFIEKQRTPQFRKADILTGENLPSGLDLVYCKKVLTPIFLGEYGNKQTRHKGVAAAIQQITTTLNPGGQIIAIEKNSGNDFRPLFEDAGLQVIMATRFERGEINGGKRITTHKTQFNRYIYQKQ